MNNPHGRGAAQSSEKHVLVLDYAFLGKTSVEDAESEQLDAVSASSVLGLPILVVTDRSTKAIFAHVVPVTGIHQYAVNCVLVSFSLVGNKSVALKSEQEPSFIALKSAIINDFSGDAPLEGSSVGDHSSNGDIERTV